MYKQLLLASTLSLSLITAPSAMAGNDDHDHDYDHGRDRGNVVNHRDDRRDDRRDHDQRWDHRRDDDHRGWQNEREHRWQGTRYHAAPYHAPRGYYRHSWRAGERLPYGYRNTRYVVTDYQHYHLYAPPRGHQWVRVDRDVVLTAVATGVVAAVVYNLFS
jgi:Ni/Co efflux regulator RcnB